MDEVPYYSGGLKLQDLPDEALIPLPKYLDLVSSFCFGLTCKQFHALHNECYFTKPRLDARNPLGHELGHLLSRGFYGGWLGPNLIRRPKDHEFDLECRLTCRSVHSDRYWMSHKFLGSSKTDYSGYTGQSYRSPIVSLY